MIGGAVPEPCESAGRGDRGGGDAVALRYGYTMADLAVLTRRAALGSRWRFIGFDERADVARFGIVEYLLTATEPPGFWDLVNAGERAIRLHVEAEEHWGGFYLTRSGVEPGTPMVRFLRYWRSTAQPTRSPEHQIVDVLALRQIWPKLTKGQRAALVALAKHDDYEKAAAEVGCSYHTLVSHLFNARKVFLRWWHQHEQPSRPWSKDMRGQRDPQAPPSHRTVSGSIRRRERRRDKKAAGDTAGPASVETPNPMTVDTILDESER